MRSETKHRFKVASGGLFLSMLVTFFSAGLTISAIHYLRHGGEPPEAVGWVGGFILISLVALLAILPSLLVILVCGATWKTQLRRHALLNCFVALGLGSFFGVLLMSVGPSFNGKPVIFFVVAGSFCLAITGVVEVLARSKLQTQKLGGGKQE